MTKFVWKFEELKSQNFKSCMFDDPVIVNTAFSFLKYSISWLTFAQIMQFNQIKCLIFAMFGKICHYNVVSVKFRKNFKGLLFCGGWVKELETFNKTFFGISFQKSVLSSFMLFSSVCYQDDPSDVERNEIASLTVRNFNNNWLLYVEFSETINLCRDIWLIEDWKCQLFYFWNKRRQKEQIFKGLFLSNAWPYGYDFWRVFGDLCEASSKYNFVQLHVPSTAL